ncbi:MAG: STAS domain-containing protein [Lachnospiraceae bacterium]|nr:STAS domain-containing protein [Lachnospiraceae bacterium]
MTITETKGEGTIQLGIEGNVDTNTAPQLQSRILQSFQKSKNVVLEMGECPYMSSAGLRALLLGQKTAMSKGGKLTLVNVRKEVQDIFKLTKFDSVLNIVS